MPLGSAPWFARHCHECLDKAENCEPRQAGLCGTAGHTDGFHSILQRHTLRSAQSGAERTHSRTAP